MTRELRERCFVLFASVLLVPLGQDLTLAQSERLETVGERLWIWGHPAGVYNESFLANSPKKSAIEPVAAAEFLGVRNMIFVRYDGRPTPPFDSYYLPFKKLDRVYWSLVGASGVTSDDEREHVFRLAADNDNIQGFILDDFFHASATGTATDYGTWLAENEVRFPVTLTLTSPVARTCDRLELVQSDWPTGDYRSRSFVVEVSSDGSQFRQVARSTLPNVAAETVSVNLPRNELLAVRIGILDSHDTQGARSCGLSAVRLYDAEAQIDLHEWRAQASSNYPERGAEHLVGTTVPYPASLSPQQLQDLSLRAVRQGRKLPIMAVIYTGQLSLRAKSHLDQVDQVCLWTWRPADLQALESNLEKLERLVGDKPILLGCYMYDFAERRPLPVELMQRQTEAGYRWLKEGRVEGLIFLATANVDVGLEAVAWTRDWIARLSDEPLPRRHDSSK
ncbi:MAG: hypothetical protein ACYC4U_05035 [Pirellulaceae bacterium]